MNFRKSVFLLKMSLTSTFSYIKVTFTYTNNFLTCNYYFEKDTLNKYNKNGVLRNGEYDMGDYVAYFKDGVFHRDDDLPAVIRKNGQKEWWFDGELKRSRSSDRSTQSVDLKRNNSNPMIIFGDNSEMWFSYEFTDDTETVFTAKYYHHRSENKGDYSNTETIVSHLGFLLPKEVYTDKTNRFYDEDGKYHRDPDPFSGVGRPAVIYENGDVEYWKNGLRYYPGGESVFVSV
jgi:hypothetical protein